MPVKPSLTVEQQVKLLKRRGLVIDDEDACARFLTTTNYYRFSGYARYFQRAPHDGDDMFIEGTPFDDVRSVYDADESLRALLAGPLAQAELVLRTGFARAVAHNYTPYERYLAEDFYTEVGNGETTVEVCLRDLDRSKEHHIARFRIRGDNGPLYPELPIWSSVEAWSFGTLSKAIERAQGGAVAASIAESMGIGKTGFATRVRALVYLRNRCAHHARLWHHSVINSGPTPNNVRNKAKRLAGQFEARSVIDVIASLDDITGRAGISAPVLPSIHEQHPASTRFWEGLAHPRNPKDHIARAERT